MARLWSNYKIYIILADHLMRDGVDFGYWTHRLELVKDFLHAGHDQTELGRKFWNQTILDPLLRMLVFGVFTG